MPGEDQIRRSTLESPHPWTPLEDKPLASGAMVDHLRVIRQVGQGHFQSVDLPVSLR